MHVVKWETPTWSGTQGPAPSARRSGDGRGAGLPGLARGVEGWRSFLHSETPLHDPGMGLHNIVYFSEPVEHAARQLNPNGHVVVSPLTA